MGLVRILPQGRRFEGSSYRQTPCSQGLVWREQSKEVQVGDMKLTWTSAVLESVQSLQNKWKFSGPGDCKGVVRVGSVFDGVGLGQWSMDAHHSGLWVPVLLPLDGRFLLPELPVECSRLSRVQRVPQTIVIVT